MARTYIASCRVAALAATISLLTFGSGRVDAQKSAVPARPDAPTVMHVLNRLGFGPKPGDLARVQDMGLAAYIDQQLHPERIPDASVRERLSVFETLHLSTGELADQYFRPADQLRAQIQRQPPQPPGAVDPAMAGAAMTPPAPPAQPQLTPEQRQIQQRQQLVVNELMQAKVLRATMSERQLEEVLADFWFNHFNVFVGKGQVRQYLTEYERDVIRPHVLGRFRDLLGATAHSPAMLFYLDNFQSRTPNPPVVVNPQMEQRLRDPNLTPQQRDELVRRLDQMRNQQQRRRPQGGLNENYARELMELHTLGVDGGYTQQDVIEVARILTGWTIDRPQQGGQFVFKDVMHDGGTKKVLGKVFSPGGQNEGERLLDLLASHPATAHHIAFQLAQRFVADDPPKALVDRAAKVFLATKGDLREVTRAIITSPEFFDPRYFGAKVKTPLEFAVSAARAADANLVNPQPVVQALRDLGMPLYGCQPPTGYSMTADAWVNTGALLSRMNFALQLVSGGFPPRPAAGDAAARPGQNPARANQPGRQNPPGGRGGLGPMRPGQLARMPIQVDIAALAPDTSDASRDRLIDAMLGSIVSDATRQTIARADTPQQLIALALGSPEFQKR